MNNLFNPATRTAELLQKRSREGQIEMLETALTEGYANISSNGTGCMPCTFGWHNMEASGTDELDAIYNWINLVERTAEGEAQSAPANPC
ncbi:MAG: hypothetical protein COB08_005620 [Rhodobacteraceae bacterium]|nr:hypothetical protein [Paracoccaceae bacterium]